MQAIHARRALVGGSFVGPVSIAVSRGVIHGVQPASTGARAAGTWLDSGFLTAGLVDLQLNGSYGVDFAAARPDQWQMVSQALTATGCTAYAPTFITAPLAEMAACLDRTFQAQQAQTAAVPQARILGAHLEGPFVSAQRAGAHDAGLMLDPGPDELAVLLATPQRRAALSILTLAPERRFALAAIRALTAQGVLVSVGHTDAGAARASEAAEAGARLVTHLFNAMGGLDHRSSSLPGRVLADRRFSLGLVADLHHVDADLVRLVLAAAADRVVLVSDAVAAAGAPPGTYGLGGTQVTTTSDDPLPRRSDGVLAGSVLRMDQAVRNLVGLGVGLEHSLLAASRNPANALARPDLGSISCGANADLVWWSDELEVRQTWVGGRTCLQADG